MTQRKARQALLSLLGLLWLLVLPGDRNECDAQERGNSEIRGRITITARAGAPGRRAAATERYPGHGGHSAAGGGISSPAGSFPRASDFRLSERVVVYIEGDNLEGGKYPPPEKNPVLDQKNLQFHPEVLPILVGTTVEFPNRDNLFHNVFSYSRPKEFDLGRYPRDDSRSVLFDRPGLVRVYCDIHAEMYATIVVLPHPFFATPDDDGTYVIPRVPDGKYTVVFWVDRNVAERRSVVVRAGETAEINFTN